MEAPRLDRARHLGPKDQVRQVRPRNQDPLRAREAPRSAEVEEPLDLGAHAADRLNLAELVHASRDRHSLVDAHVSESGKDGKELARRRAVAVDLAVALLERDLGTQAEGPLLPEHAPEIAPQDRHAFRVDGSAELRLAFDVDDPLATEGDNSRDTHRL